MAEFDTLHHLLNMDLCSVEVLVTDLDDCVGMFIPSYKDELLRNYIVLDNSLFDISERKFQEHLKMVGIHEFCHFLAVIYSVTNIGVDNVREIIKERLNGRIDRLPLETLQKMFLSLSNKIPVENTGYIEELTDEHFRLGMEEETPNYRDLFCQFMFSKDLFETEFSTREQVEFGNLLIANDFEKALVILMDSIEKICLEKDIPTQFAVNQVSKWLPSYISEEFSSAI
jgi:hypothetical protein